MTSPAPANRTRMVVLRLTLNVAFATPVLEVSTTLNVIQNLPFFFSKATCWPAIGDDVPRVVRSGFDFAVTLLPLRLGLQRNRRRGFADDLEREGVRAMGPYVVFPAASVQYCREGFRVHVPNGSTPPQIWTVVVPVNGDPVLAS